jgi:hypothetical protein
MKQLIPNPTPIPPEMPSDPSRVPPPDMPINVPPEKGPGRPEPIPPGPTPPKPVARAGFAVALALALLASGAAWAQHSVGKDTRDLEKPNPQQSQCSQITDLGERQRCLQANQPSGAPATGKPTDARQAPPTGPGVGHEVRPAVPNDQSKTPTDPNKPGSSR